eukprot:4763374-Ditylum_brightwellii.AAC.1
MEQGDKPNHTQSLKKSARKLMSKKPHMSVVDIMDILQESAGWGSAPWEEWAVSGFPCPRELQKLKVYLPT